MFISFSCLGDRDPGHLKKKLNSFQFLGYLGEEKNTKKEMRYKTKYLQVDGCYQSPNIWQMKFLESNEMFNILMTLKV